MLEYYEHEETIEFIEMLESVAFYIKNILHNLDAANALIDNIYLLIEERSKSPKIEKPFTFRDGHNFCYKIKYRNFYVLYDLDEENKKMICHSFIYGRSSALKGPNV